MSMMPEAVATPWTQKVLVIHALSYQHDDALGTTSVLLSINGVALHLEGFASSRLILKDEDVRV